MQELYLTIPKPYTFFLKDTQGNEKIFQGDTEVNSLLEELEFYQNGNWVKMEGDSITIEGMVIVCRLPLDTWKNCLRLPG